VKSVASQLALALLGVVAGVLGIVYLIVVPQYQTSLRNTELASLAGVLRNELPTYPHDSFNVNQWATSMAEEHALRAIVFNVTVNPATVTPYADSFQTTNDADLVDDPVALSALNSGALARGTAVHGGKTDAEVAARISADGPVVLFASSLDEQLQTVAVVRRRVLIAGGLAAVFAALLGYAGAAAFGRRIRRLESAAERIAAGKFDEPVDDAGSDELGQLARAFERMRLRLASLDRARGEFIANASHELRTPLFSLGGFLELLDDTDLDEETRREFLGQMHEQVDRLTKLATDLLDLSRLDAGRLSVSPEPLDLTDLARELLAEFGPRSSAAGHELRLVADGPVVAVGDLERALQIGRVLLENAIVHTPRGTQISLQTGQDGGRATLAVADGGPGIPVELRAQVFERFTRLDGKRASGSGLGLAIARELAEVMGGRIELAVEDGWTRFTLVLPSDSAVST
jgi:signal transduction histidine kinase